MKFASLILSLAVLLCFSTTLVSAQSSECALCEFAVQYIDGFLQQNFTEQQIVDQLEAVCNLAPPPYSITCDSFVEQYVPSIINYIIKTENPATACAELGLCNSKRSVGPAGPVAHLAAVNVN
jgi:hypothetical protein